MANRDTTEMVRNIRAGAPALMKIAEEVLNADVWERPGLGKRDRGITTVAVLIALHRLDQLPYYMQKAMADGLTREELAELITHVGFYAGFPAAMSAAEIAGTLSGSPA